MPDFSLTCPAPLSGSDRILLAHGEGARLSRKLIREELLSSFRNEYLQPLADGAVLPGVADSLVMTTDGTVVTPLFFPGGDIGKLAIHGAINDLAVCGAEPLYLSLAIILEEGLPLEVFRRVIASVKEAARACGVPIVTGDTKVVPRGAADQIFLTTTGVGRRRRGLDLGAHRVRPGDQVLVSGTLGDHGLAILAARAGLDLGDALASDTASILGLAAALFQADLDVHFLRDPTRGGLAATLQELAEGSGLGILVEESNLPISPPARGASELLGLDPMHVANEGKVVAVLPAHQTDKALAVWKAHPQGRQAAIIGEVLEDPPQQVLIRSPLGSRRTLDEPSGAPLPRIC